MTLYAKALQFAAKKHTGHTRKNGDSYIIHPIRVSQGVLTESQKVIALLHDTLEDTGTTLDELVAAFGDRIATSVEALTRRAGEDYCDYIVRVKKDADATAVKIMDIADNLNDSPSDKAIKRSANALNELLSCPTPLPTSPRCLLPLAAKTQTKKSFNEEMPRIAKLPRRSRRKLDKTAA